MIEAIVISFIVGFAALHVVFRLSPKLVQRKVRNASAALLNRLGLHAIAQRLAAVPQLGDKVCGSGCDGCGTQTAAGDELKVGGAKVVQFYPRPR